MHYGHDHEIWTNSSRPSHQTERITADGLRNSFAREFQGTIWFSSRDERTGIIITSLSISSKIEMQNTDRKTETRIERRSDSIQKEGGTLSL